MCGTGCGGTRLIPGAIVGGAGGRGAGGLGAGGRGAGIGRDEDGSWTVRSSAGGRGSVMVASSLSPCVVNWTRCGVRRFRRMDVIYVAPRRPVP